MWNCEKRSSVVWAAFLFVLWGSAPTYAESEPDGRALFRQNCAPCHGFTGNGDGPDAALLTAPPRNLRDGVLDRYTLVELIDRVRDGKSLPLLLDPEALRARAGDTDAVVAHLKRLPEINWEKVANGWNLYADRCAECHGSYGKPNALPEGVNGSIRTLVDIGVQTTLSDENLLRAVRHGRDGMPALVPRVSVDEGKAIVAFVRLLSPGFEIYSQHCARCHSDDGKAMRDLGEVPPLPTMSFDKAYFASHTNDEVRTRIWHMIDVTKPQMPHFRYTLTHPEIRAIIEYLKKDGPPK